MSVPFETHGISERGDELKQLQEEFGRIERLAAAAVSTIKPADQSHFSSVWTDTGLLAGSRRLAHVSDLASVALASTLSASPSSVFTLGTELLETMRDRSPLDEALEQSSLAHQHALAREGLSPAVLTILKSWIDTEVQARVVQRDLEFGRALGHSFEVAVPSSPETPLPDLQEWLTASDLANWLHVSDETIRNRERDGELFSILRPGRKRGREYPMFQFWDGIRGEPLASILMVLKEQTGSFIHGFFVAPTDILGGVSPVEALIGRTLSHRPGAGDRLFAAPHTDRLAAVLRWAHTRALPIP